MSLFNGIIPYNILLFIFITNFWLDLDLLMNFRFIIAFLFFILFLLNRCLIYMLLVTLSQIFKFRFVYALNFDILSLFRHLLTFNPFLNSMNLRFQFLFFIFNLYQLFYFLCLKLYDTVVYFWIFIIFLQWVWELNIFIWSTLDLRSLTIWSIFWHTWWLNFVLVDWLNIIKLIIIFNNILSSFNCTYIYLLSEFIILIYSRWRLGSIVRTNAWLIAYTSYFVLVTSLRTF